MGAALVILTAYGGESTAPDEGQSSAPSSTLYEVSASTESLRDAGWEAEEGEGVEVYTEAQQVGYLETTAPDGELIDLQFFGSPEEAQGELEETKIQEAPFDGTAEGNVSFFGPQDEETAVVSAENLEHCESS